MTDPSKAGGKVEVQHYKPYPAYKDSGVEWLGEIPEHWEVRRLKFVAHIEAGQSPPSEFVLNSSEGLPFLQGNAEFGSLSPHHEFVCDVAAKRASTGDILLSVRAPVGDMNIADQVYGIGRGLCAIRLINTAALQFQYYLLTQTRSLLNSVATGSTYDAVTASDVANLPALLPPLPEQLSISTFLDRKTTKIDALVVKNERLIELLQEKRTALITRTVTKGLDSNAPMKDSGVEWLGEIPEHWEVKRLKYLSRSVTSGSRGWADHYADEGASFLRIGNLMTDAIDLDLSDVQHVNPPDGAENDRIRAREGDVVVSITALIGAVGVVPAGIGDAFVNQHLALVHPIHEDIAARWIGYCILSRIGQEQLRRELYGGTKDGLGLEDVRSLIIIVPPRNEQEQIISMIDEEESRIFTIIQTIRSIIDRLKELRIALISAAVTGKIDVRKEVP